MQNLVALRLEDDGFGFTVSGFVNRGKNRKCCWQFFEPHGDRKDLLAAVEAKEASRLTPPVLSGAVVPQEVLP